MHPKKQKKISQLFILKHVTGVVIDSSAYRALHDTWNRDTGSVQCATEVEHVISGLFMPGSATSADLCGQLSELVSAWQ